MRRQVLSHLEGLDSDTRGVAEAAARRSGLSLEEWVAATLAEHAERHEQPPKRMRRQAGEDLDSIIARVTRSARKRPDGSDEATSRAAATHTQERSPIDAARTAIALESMASWIEHAEERLDETARLSADHQDRMASVLSQTLSALKDRLDTVERRVVSDRAAPARIEFPIQDAIKALAPLSDTLVGLRTDMSRLAERLEQPANPAWTPAVESIRAEIEHLRSTMGGLATRAEIAELDHAIRDIAEDLERGRSNKDILTLATSISALHRQVQALAADFAEGVHRRIGSDIDLIKRKIDGVAEAGADRSVIEALSGQIVEMRRDLAQRAEPQQIDRLSDDVGALGRQIADLRANQVGRSDFAALKSSLENVCSVLNRTVAAQEASDVPVRLQDLSRRLDILASRPEPEPANLDPIAEQLALLTERMATVTDTRLEQTDTLTGLIERLSSQVQAVADTQSLPQEPLSKRFDQLEDGLRQIGQQADTSTVERMLGSITEKLERLPTPASAFDALEQRIATLADRFAQTPAEPLRQAFDDAATHFKKLQDETATIAERAAKAALKDMRPSDLPSGDLDALKQGFVELKALQTRADKKTQHTLRAVHDALETLISRFPGHAAVARPGLVATQGATAKAPDDMLPADRLEAAVRRLHAAALSQIEEVSATPGESEKPQAEADLPQGVATSFALQENGLGNVRASFIAAARRASQTAAPDNTVSMTHLLANDEVSSVGQPDDQSTSEDASRSAPTLIERIRRTFDAHRRPLLFSLAFLILAAGTAQIMSGGRDPQLPFPAPKEPERQMAALAETEQVQPKSADESAGIAPASPSGSELFQPSSLTAGSFTTAKFLVDPNTVGELPTQLPAQLRDAALTGDASAIHEIAVRASEGRGIPQDLALAVRLHERAAQSGFAPAQERLAMLHEKGLGVPRDAKLAAAWHERAAQGGNIRAMHNLATLLVSGVHGKPDYPSALRWYSEAAEAGVRDSQFNMGVLFARGIGTRQDPGKAFKWFALAAAQGDAEAVKKRDEMASRLNAADLAAAKASVENWHARAFDPVANDALPAADGRTAALDRASGGKI
jgi:localization factor PodJL